MRCLSLMALSSMDSDGRRNPSLHVSVLFREFLGLYSFCSAKWESSRSACHREVDLEKAEIPENLAYNHKSQKSKITFPYKLIIFPCSVIRLVSRPIKAHSFFFHAPADRATQPSRPSRPLASTYKVVPPLAVHANPQKRLGIRHLLLQM
jgi:hypothetical protein